MNYTLNTDRTKKQAKTLRTYLSSINRSITHAVALEAVARVHGARDWNVLSAALGNKSPETNTAAPKSKQFFVDMGGVKTPFTVSAEVWSDDARVRAKFDATPWFAEATDEELIALAGQGWWRCEEADEVAQYVEGTQVNPEVNDVFEYLQITNKNASMYADPVGFEVEVSTEGAMQYCRAFRYPVFVKLMLIERYGSLKRAQMQHAGVYRDDVAMEQWWLHSSDTSYPSEAEAYEALGPELEKCEFKEWSSSVFEVTPGSGSSIPAADISEPDVNPLMPELFVGPAALDMLNRCLNSFADESATGKLWVLESSLGSWEQLTGLSDERLPWLQMVVVDSGNSSGDSWKYTYYPQSHTGLFIKEN